MGADGTMGGGVVVGILHCLSLYSWSDFLYKSEPILKTCHCTLPPGLTAFPFLLG